MTKLNWKVLRINLNTDKLEWINIFDVICPCASNWEDENCKWDVAIKNYIKNGEITSRDKLKEKLDMWFCSMFWARAQYEFIAAPKYIDLDRKLESKDFEEVNVYEQLKQNLDRIVDYVIAELKLNFK